jgi:hypothetical protein
MKPSECFFQRLYSRFTQTLFMRRWLPLMAGVILVFTLINGGAEPKRVDFCRQTAQDALTSCQAGAQSDYSLALGKCDNLSDPAAREACRTQASADLQDARQTCQTQENARLAACQRLGGAPYDPVIDPLELCPAGR